MIAYIVIVLVVAFAIWQIRQSYESALALERHRNKDLLDRLLTKNQMPPSEVNLTQVYEERKQERKTEQANPKKAYGPVEKLTEKWAVQDRIQADKSGRVN